VAAGVGGTRSRPQLSRGPHSTGLINNSPRSGGRGSRAMHRRRRVVSVTKTPIKDPHSNKHISTDNVALCLEQTFCDGYHRSSMRYRCLIKKQGGTGSGKSKAPASHCPAGQDRRPYRTAPPTLAVERELVGVDLSSDRAGTRTCCIYFSCNRVGKMPGLVFRSARVSHNNASARGSALTDSAKKLAASCTAYRQISARALRSARSDFK
jgi:hypothetical protein